MCSKVTADVKMEVEENNPEPVGEPEMNREVPGENPNAELAGEPENHGNPGEAPGDDEEEEAPGGLRADEWIEFVAEQLVEWNVTHEELYGLVSIVHGDYNELALRGSPLVQPAIMRCIAEHMDFDTLKQLRLAAKVMKTMVEPYFYKRGTFRVTDTTEFYKFIKKANTENHLIPLRMKRIEFRENIDLFEVSRVVYRARSNLKELSVITTAPKLRGEFQNIAGILPVMEKLHTLRLHLPRRYLLHQLFRSTPLKTIKTIQFNFENAHPATLGGIFNTCAALEYIEMSTDQLKYLHKLTSVIPIDVRRCRSKKVLDNEFQVLKIVRKQKEEVQKK